MQPPDLVESARARTVPIADARRIADGRACGEGLEIAVAVDVEEATAFDVAAGASASHGARSCPNSSLSSTLVASAAQFTRALSVRVECAQARHQAAHIELQLGRGRAFQRLGDLEVDVDQLLRRSKFRLALA